MKSIRLIAASAALAAALPIAVAAQTTARQPAAGVPAGSAAAPSLMGKIAVIDSGAFTDDKQGITRVVNAMRGVDAQFQPQRTELQGLQTRYNALVEEIQKTGAVASPQTLAAKQEQADTLKRDIERKAQDAQAAIEKRSRDTLGPLQEEVFNALQTYAQQRGISLIIDMNRVPVIYAADSVDITRDFITDYNRTHPATASTGRP